MKFNPFPFLLLGILQLVSHDGVAWAASNSQAEIQLGLGVEIDRVDINGVKLFPTSVIESSLEIGPGDKLERLKVIRTEQNLQSLYVRHGYEEVGIRSRLVRKRNKDKTVETVLEFSISEGRPIRIASIHFALQGAQEIQGVSDERTKKLWATREKQLKSSLTFSVGDIYDQEKLNEVKLLFQEQLASAEFIGVKVNATRNNVAFDPNSFKDIKGTDVSKWVGIEFQIDLGERVNFGFRGNTVFTKGYLDGLIDEQRLLGLGKDYVGIIKAKLEDEYRSAGYAKVDIAPYTFENPMKYERKVTFAIKEGPRVKIDSIDFDGNLVFGGDELRKQFFSKASMFIQNDIYVEKDIQKAAEFLVEWMKEKGYLSARVVTTNTLFPPKPRTQIQNSSVRLLIYLYEGDQTLVDNILIKGSSLFSSAEISKLLRMQTGQPLNLFAFGDGVERLKRAYKDAGYLDFRIVNEGTDTLIKYSQDNRLASLALQVEEGERFRVSRIEIEGLSNTHESIVSRELRIKVGEILRDTDIVQSERRLRKLGIFSAVSLKPIDDPTQPGYKIVRVSLREADRGVLVYGPGYRNDLGIRLFSQFSYSNLWGENQTASISASANRRFYNYNFVEGQAQIAYSWPWFGIPELNFRPTAAAGRTQYINFSADTATLAANWDKQLLSDPNITGYISYTIESIHQTLALESIDNGEFTIGTITPKVTLDLRDSPLSPTRGFFSTVWLDLALPAFGSQGNPAPIAYYRAQMRSDYYVPLTRDIVWYFSFRTGYEQTLTVGNNPSFIPLIKEFALGGIASIRGYQEQQINYPQNLSNPNPSFGESLAYVNYRTQVDLPFAGALKFGIFLDAGNLLVNNFSFGGLSYGTGFGFHYQTPIGPINFDWGFPINPAPGTDPYIIHFSVGII